MAWRRSKNPCIGLAAALAISAMTSISYSAQDENGVGDDTLVSANSLTYDEKLGLIVASGDVEAVIGDTIYLSDTMTYNERDDVLTASGNVSVVMPDGNVVFTDFAVLTDQQKRGVVDKFRMLWSDGTRVVADRAEFVEGQKRQLYNAVMSPCNLCAEDPTRAPLWQIKSPRVVEDRTTQDVKYYDATLEMFGIPVFYTPFYSHASPEVERRSGFLSPDYSFNDNLGFVFRLPYYYSISNSEDLTVTPIITTEERAALSLEYRRHFRDGELTFFGSGTYVQARDSAGNLKSGDEVRGHIESHGRFDINNNWRWGFDVHRASDRTYLRRYEFESPTTLASNLFVEGFGERGYAFGTATSFQGQRSTDNFAETPNILPLIEFSHISEPNEYGARWGVDGSFVNIFRPGSARTRRLSVEGEFYLPHTFENGHQVSLTTTLLGQVYWSDLLVDPMMPQGATIAETAYRIYPQLIADWRYPLVRQVEGGHQLIEPIVAFVASPNEANDDPDIPNEDSIDLELNDTNLFSGNRFPGVDALDSGQRIVYGLRAGHFSDSGIGGELFVGQSYRLYGDGPFFTNSGLEDSFSDIVASFNATPISGVNLSARARIDKDNGAPRTLEIDSSFRFDPVTVNIDYTFVDQLSGIFALSERNQLNTRVQVQLDEYWRVSAQQIYDFGPDSGPRSSRLSAIYEDECFTLESFLQIDDFTDADADSNTSLFFRLTYKHLGSFGLNAI